MAGLALGMPLRHPGARSREQLIPKNNPSNASMYGTRFACICVFHEKRTIHFPFKFGAARGAARPQKIF